MKYKIPHSFLDKFTEVSGRNYSSDGRSHVETLAYLLGHETANEIIATDLVFPDQRGHLDHVDDEGNTFWSVSRVVVFYYKYFDGIKVQGPTHLALRRILLVGEYVHLIVCHTFYVWNLKFCIQYNFQISNQISVAF